MNLQSLAHYSIYYKHSNEQFCTEQYEKLRWANGVVSP